MLAHPSPDLYGSDRMLLESVRAFVPERRVVVTLPEDGPLCARLRDAGAEVVLLPVPVLRKSALRRPVGLTAAMLRAIRPAIRLLRRERASVLYVNTITLPLWLLAGRLARVPVLCHVHEAEDRLPGPLRALLYLPLRLAGLVVANSNATAASMGRVVRRSRVRIVPNGVAEPPAPIPPVSEQAPAEPRLVLIGRLSANKGDDLAIKAVQLLRRRGHKVNLTLVGSVYPGYEWYERELRDLAAQPESAGAVEFAGFHAAPWESLAAADIAVVPSRLESFGLVAVEAMLAGRPVVACATQGLTEVVTDGETGVLVAPDDPAALADGVQGLLEDWAGALRMAGEAKTAAIRRFGKAGYYHELRQAVQRLAPGPADLLPPAPTDPQTVSRTIEDPNPR